MNQIRNDSTPRGEENALTGVEKAMAKDVKVSVHGTGQLKIEGTCTVTNKPYSVIVDHYCWKKWQMGVRAQVAFRDLSPSEREFVISGMTPAEWEALIGNEEE